MQVELRTFTEEEYHEFFRGYEPDPLIDPAPFVYDPRQIAVSYRYNHDGFRDHYCHYGIFADGKPVGSFQLKRIDPEKRRCEFGIILQNETVRNRGIGTEAIRLGMDTARNQFGVLSVIGDTMGRNKRMQRVFGKLGFRLTGRKAGALRLPDGTVDDCLVYEKELSEDKIG